MRLGAGVGGWECLWGRVRAGVLGGGGGLPPPPPVEAIPSARGWGPSPAPLDGTSRRAPDHRAAAAAAVPPCDKTRAWHCRSPAARPECTRHRHAPPPPPTAPHLRVPFCATEFPKRTAPHQKPPGLQQPPPPPPSKPNLVWPNGASNSCLSVSSFGRIGAPICTRAPLAKKAANAAAWTPKAIVHMPPYHKQEI